MRPRAEHRSAVGAQRRPPQHEPLPDTACRAARGRRSCRNGSLRENRPAMSQPPRPTFTSAPARPTPLELADVPWLDRLDPQERQRAQCRPEGGAGRRRRAAVPRRPAGDLLVRRDRRPAEDEQRHRARRADHVHRPAAGRLVRRRHGDQARGLPLQHPGAAPQRGRRPAASRPSTGCSTAAFRSTASSMQQLNERLGQFIAAREIDRLSDPDARVARSLAALFHPVLYPGRRHAAAHHAAGARLPRRPVAPARQRGACARCRRRA